MEGIYFKLNRETLWARLKELSSFCELIIFTSLPKRFLDKLMERLPEFQGLFNYVISQEILISD